jgi:hypothetical protein
MRDHRGHRYAGAKFDFARARHFGGGGSQSPPPAPPPPAKDEKPKVTPETHPGTTPISGPAAKPGKNPFTGGTVGRHFPTDADGNVIGGGLGAVPDRYKTKTVLGA